MLRGTQGGEEAGGAGGTAGLTAPEGTSNDAKAYTGFEMLPYQDLLDFYSTLKPNPLFSAGPLSPSGREASGSQDL